MRLARRAKNPATPMAAATCAMAVANAPPATPQPNSMMNSQSSTTFTTPAAICTNIAYATSPLLRMSGKHPVVTSWKGTPSAITSRYLTAC